MFNPQSIDVTSNGNKIKVHLFSTGGIKVKRKFYKARFSGFTALIDFILDKNFTDWLPVWVMVIEHPEGIFIIDTGEIADINNPGYFNSSGFIAKWFDTTQFRFNITKDDEVEYHLQRLQIDKSNIKAVVLTHLHFDHTDGLKYFPNNNIIVNKAEYEKPFGDLPKLYPSWFAPTPVELNESFDVFDKVYYLTDAKDLLLIETPGHTYHHCSVLLKTDACNILFAADICYTQQQLIEESFPGNNASNKLAKTTYDKVKTFSQKHKTVFIPSHDPEAGERLNKLHTIFK
jgi:glyoxylase-like metal-dependent hydrolase (beta-lactamase superfamily II)